VAIETLVLSPNPFAEELGCVQEDAVATKECNSDAILNALNNSTNTHLIEGCLEGEIEAFTIVDDQGNALFPPKPLTELGFVSCCPSEVKSNSSPTLPESNGKLVSDNFQDGNGRANFNLQIRNTGNSEVNWEALISNSPYEIIPDLNLPDEVTLSTTQNLDKTYSHLFAGFNLAGFANVVITGGLPDPAGIGSGLSLFCEVIE